MPVAGLLRCHATCWNAGSSGVRGRVGACTRVWLTVSVLFGALALPSLSRANLNSLDGRPADRISSNAAPAWTTIELPGTEEGLLGVLGLDAGMPRARIMPAVIRSIHRAPVGDDRAADRSAALVAAYFREVGGDGPSFRVPLPLSPADWQGRFLPDEEAGVTLGVAILADRELSWLYLALMSMDPESARRLVASVPAATLRREAPVLAAVARSLVVGSTGLVVPGGPAAASLWESLVGAPVSDAARFVERLLGRDQGVMARFYDVVAGLDGPHQRFALHLATSDEVRRRHRFGILYSAFAKCESAWQPRLRPFAWPPFDGTMLLRLIAITDQGRVVGPSLPSVWDAMLGSGRRPGDQTPGTGRSEEVDAALLATLVLERGEPAVRQERLETLLFGQRVFAAVEDTDWPSLVPVVRSFWSHRALMLVLERLGVTDPKVYETAVRSASLLNGIALYDDRVAAMAQFQGLLSLIDHLATRGSLDGDTARSLAGEAVSLVPGLNGRYQGRIASWIDRHLLPVLSSTTAGEGSAMSAEERVLRALAGPAPTPAASLVTWEGQRYRVDLQAGELGRLRVVRSALGDATLDQALVLSALASTFVFEPVSVANARALATRLAEAVARIAGVALPSGRSYDAAAVRSVVAGIGEVAGRLRTDRDLRQTLAAGRPLFELADATVGAALVALSYAVELGDPSSVMAGSGNVVAAHDFGLRAPRVSERFPLEAWLLPRETIGDGRGWRLVGSLLALDSVLATTRLRRVSAEPLLRPPRTNPNDRRGLAHSLALLRPAALDEPTAVAIVQGLCDGLTRIENASNDADSAAALAREAGADWWRVNSVRWSAGEQPALVAKFFSVADQLRLGAPGLDALRLARWGLSVMSLGGGLLARYPEGPELGELVGRPGLGLAATRVPDLQLRTTSELVARGLPAMLAPAVIAFALQDYLDEAQPADGDDWLTLATHAREMAPTRFDDYIAALTARGPLVPVAEER